MSNPVIKQIPNTLTTLRLLSAAPISLMILSENYQAVLWIAFFAGITDALDGWLARKLDCMSRYGAVVDPLSDKALLFGAYISFVVVGLIPWWIGLVVITRDIIIVSGALAYHSLIGRYDMAPSIWGKVSTQVQIVFALMLLVHQVYPVFPQISFLIGILLLVLLAFGSCGHYVFIWGSKALVAFRDADTEANNL
ncbi:MAG TPA: CDP-alcohol phosphatidyltransferase family protein [Pseudomonadales bacterium]|jgi:cardiolipin synthase|nr:CDP-alcohol phosphatidyltransferase [Gammaproteobacteria bacterium]MDP6026114.1 CDP-alcohol phosphatidyltransferase family protein [Pseudomonadales bacterium]MDP6316086.1 CDP-alcohol phosphatidyltransferase family protein [Pseudomonadales bacterium]MDP7315556.1 CDP-alcohol phosphatidyltransferase family protein [Pseudomonadales bacterium]MDP7575671.1 CDP-alcohol phosphatidyltransferase family protein [Pseudomonadales bacterium]|tara:strand:+ start:111 stop:695 length:585 start_codon:yes stop_codon:yes gene_type:complete